MGAMHYAVVLSLVGFAFGMAACISAELGAPRIVKRFLIGAAFVHIAPLMVLLWSRLFLGGGE